MRRRQNPQGTLRAAECRSFIVEKSVVMVYNKLLNFSGVTDGYDKPGFDVVKAFMKKLNTF